MNIPLQPSWTDIAVRLALTMLAGAIIGFNRGARGHAAGFRTTILVGLAASVAMIQANILLSVSGKTPQSFAIMDLMRLPLGILTGVGFIGGGAILKRGDLITGVTTAATLWLMTVIGLCLGGGQLLLGTAATVLAVLTLWILKWVDGAIPREHHARLVVTCETNWNVVERVSNLVEPMKYRAHFQGQKHHSNSNQTDYAFELSWHRPDRTSSPLDVLHVLDQDYRITLFELMTDR
ncbi:MgtC/SapB family protein [Bradyrhizobium sp. STM 3562]|uniref:MgtC/SapB family protein n=1 Tax=Bradyrhizobium sp. STM 3562 TaxID=578924 RepID=UPI0038903268